MARFKPGDVIDIIAWDQGDEQWDRGVIEILEHQPIVSHTKNGCYVTQNLTGSVTWISVNADILDNADHFDVIPNLDKQPHWTKINECYYKYIGNTNTDYALKVLYGRKGT